MKTTAKQTRTISKKQKILIAIAGILIILASWWAYVNFMPHPLGEKLEYIGKENLGGGLFFYDYHPYSVYYYGTDATAEELKTYFNKAHYDNSIRDIHGSAATYSFKDMHFTSAKGDFAITYYSDVRPVLDGAHLPMTNKKNVISVAGSEYERVKSSL